MRLLLDTHSFLWYIEDDDKLSQFIPEQLLINQIDVLPISLPHLARYTELPFHHRDPFDRLIIAQALVEDIPVVSRDKPFQEYSIDVIW